LIALGFCAFLWNQGLSSKTVQFPAHRNLALMTLCFSVSGIMQWYNLKTYDLVFLAVHQELVVLLVAGFMLYFLKQSPIPFFKLDYIPVMALVVSVAILSGMYGLKVTNPFISSIISLTSSIFTIILAVILLKENFKWHYVISMLTVLFGAWLLS
jgi:drug/metabolite transporter (DMT)-like permease